MGAVPDKYVLVKESNGNVTMIGYEGITEVERYSLDPAKDMRISQSYPESIIIPVNSIGNHVDNKFVSIPWERIDFAGSTPPSFVGSIIDAVEALGRDFFYQSGAVGPQGPTGATGAQGPIGPQGVPGPVGPAGLNWQGAWSASGTYVVDDAVGYNGASWFCINNVGPSVTPPDVDTANWALLAAQGATGPQGPQGIQGPAGTEPVKTSGTVAATFVFPGTLMTYDINYITGTSNQMVQLPQNAPIGKEIAVFGSPSTGTINYIIVKAFGGTNTIYNNGLNVAQDFYYLYRNEMVKFISLGGNSWKAEYVPGSSVIYNSVRLSASNNYTITDTVINTTISPLSASQLNSSYSSLTWPVGLKVICKDITGGGLMYIRTGTSTWVSAPITEVL